MQQKIEDKIYGNEGNPDLLSKIVGSNATILDVGCGDGSNAKVLIKSGHTIDGITISETEANAAKQYCRNVFIYNLEEGLPEVNTNSYDYVICSHVLEHICRPTKLLSNINTVLKPNGKLLVALPNLFHYASRFQIFFGNFYYKESGIWDNTHYKWYTFRTAQNLLAEHGFTCTVAYTTGDIPFLSRINFIKKSSFYKLLNNLLLKTAPGFWGYQLVYVAQKNNSE